MQFHYNRGHSYLTTIRRRMVDTTSPWRFFIYTILVVALAWGCATGSPELRDAESAFEDGEYESAISSLNRALEEDSANTSAYLLKARIFREMADTSREPEAYVDLHRRAMAVEDSALTFDAELEGDVEGRRQELFRTELKKGESAYNRANKNDDPTLYQHAVAFFGAAGVLQSDSAGPLLKQAYAYLKLKQRDAAVPSFEEYVSRVDTMSLNAAKILGKLYVSAGKHRDAAEFLTLATRYHPNDEELHALRLTAYNKAGNVDRALLTYREQIERAPNNPSYRFNYGSLLLKARRYIEAIPELERAVELRPHHIQSQYNLGAAYLNAALVRDDSISALRQRMTQEDAGGQITFQEIDSLTAQRQTLFRQAVPPLERSRKMTSDTDEIHRDACRALLVAYVRTNRPNKAAEVEDCTGLNRASRNE